MIENTPATHRPVTVKDIAQRCGVHFMTVSRALRGDPRVKPATTEAIKAMATEMGYDPANGHAARRLVMQGRDQVLINKAISLFFPPNFVRNMYFADLFEGIIEELTPEGFTIHLIPTYNPESPDMALPKLPDVFRRGDTDGAIVTRWPPLCGPLLEQLRHEPNFGNRPVLSLLFKLPGCSAVFTDDFVGMYAAMQHLLDLGHRKFLHFYWCFDEEVEVEMRQRYSALCQACSDRGLDPAEHLIVGLLDWESSLHHRMEKPLRTALRAHPDITAVIAPNDFYAVQAVDILRTMQLTVPGDISLLGFDDIIPLMNSAKDNILTTVRLPLEAVGREAARIIMGRINGTITEAHTIILPTEFIPRSSTAPPRRG